MSRLDQAVAGPMRQHMKYRNGKYVPKAAYPTREAALAVLASKTEPDLTTYQCDICRQWHLGHDMKLHQGRAVFTTSSRAVVRERTDVTVPTIKMTDEIRKAAQSAVEQGWKVEPIDGSRLRWTPPDKDKQIVVTSSNPQAGSSLRNALQHLKRNGLVLNNPNPPKKETPVAVPKPPKKQLPTYAEMLASPEAVKGLTPTDISTVVKNADKDSIEVKLGLALGKAQEHFQTVMGDLATDLMAALKEIGFDDKLETQALEAMEELDSLKKTVEKLQERVSEMGDRLKAAEADKVAALERAVSAENKLRMLKEALS